MTTDSSLQSLLRAVCDLAVRVGHYQAEQRRTFSRDAVETKHAHDYVSYVDKESERQIVASLKPLLPDAGFTTEEKTTEQNSAAPYEWIIDPLDGTTNYIHDLGPYCVCIALKHHGKLVLGVVYEVTRSELFYATKGGGAHVCTVSNASNVSNADSPTPTPSDKAQPNSSLFNINYSLARPLHVSDVSDIDGALICLGYPYNADAYRPLGLALIRSLYGRCVSIRSLGSAEAELCSVAAGRLDVFLEPFLCPWDVSAGALILQEAGGRITDFQGEDRLWPSGREVLATNGLLHEAMLEEVALSTK